MSAMSDGERHALTCDRCGAGRGPWDSYAEGRILLCSECRKNVPVEVRFAPIHTTPSPIEQELLCPRAERDEVHDAHDWRWYGRWIVADHTCPGVTAPDERTTTEETASA